MDQRAITRGSKRLSWLLRFGAVEAGVKMDEAGWVPVKAALKAARLEKGQLEEIVHNNNKQRFELQGRKIRACQGHGRELPVTQDALEASWEVFDGPDHVWHGTHPGAVEGIAAEGLLPIDRTHVHLAEHKESRLGKRAGVGLLLIVSVPRLRELDQEVYRSPNGVLLTRHVPPEAITGQFLISKRARKAEGQLRQLLGLDVEGSIQP